MARNVVGFMAEKGREWLERLPALVAEYSNRWGLVPGVPYAGMTYNYLVRAERADGTKAVLKLGVPGGPIHSEVDALRAFDGRGCVRLLDSDREAGVLLLERLEPAETLKHDMDDDAATLAVAEVMLRVRRPVPDEHSFSTVRDWSDGLKRLRETFDGGTGPFPVGLVERAERLYAELFSTATETCLLHGDLHHLNVLSAEREPWLAVDPQGVIGDPAYETPPFLRNNLEDKPYPVRVVASRIELLADSLGLDRERILMTAQAESVLSAWWHYEDNDPDVSKAIPLAELMNSVSLRG